MADAKIEFSIGNIKFVGEGEAKWVSEQLDKIIDKAADLIKLSPPEKQTQSGRGDQHCPMGTDKEIANKNLASFLKEKNATSNQVKKFLTTAAWLEAKGKTRISTAEITDALRSSSQSKLNNASLCLIKNVQKGYCEKDGSQFFVTQEGKDSLQG